MIPIIGFFVSQSIEDKKDYSLASPQLKDSNQDFGYATVPAYVRKSYYDNQEVFSDLEPKECTEPSVPEDFVLYI